MRERTFEAGGEALGVGDTVIVFDGNSQKERAITQVGTRRVHIESIHRGQPIPFSLEDRKSLQGPYTYYFRTKTEVAEYARRDVLRSRLQDLGMELSIRGGVEKFRRYPLAALEQVVEILEANTPK